jgi:hypothetical protein
MIESRYSIEYIDPNSEKSSSKLGRFFIYSTLIISILIAITAIIFSNLPEGTSQTISSKVQQFISSFDSSSSNQPTDKVVVTPKTKTPLISIEEQSTQVEKKDEIAQQKLVAAQLEDEYKEEIERLSQENTEQHDESIKQLTKNQLLTKKLDVLSKQLNDERQKSSQLKNKVSSLLIKNTNVSNLLAKTEDSVKDYANKIEQLKNKEVEILTQSIATETSAINTVIKEKIEPELLTTETTDKSKENLIVTDKVKTPTSQIDAIVAAMEAANNKTNNTQKPTTKDQ